MNNNTGDKGSIRPSGAAPKRVAGGLVIKAKKKKKTNHQKSTPRNNDADNQSTSVVPSILTNIPAQHHEEDQNPSKASTKHDEFEDTAAFDEDEDVPSDALLCLQTYTRSSYYVGGMSESCAYCPIFTHEEQGDGSVDNGSGSISTHAVPFLPRHVLNHLLQTSSTNNYETISSRTRIEQEIKQLALSNKVRLLQLHGTAMNMGSNNGCDGRGDGNDDEDIAVMEITSYLAAAEMALQHYFQAQSTSVQHTCKIRMVYSWFTTILLPYFSGKIWFSAGALDSFYEHVMASPKMVHSCHAVDTSTTKIHRQHSLSQMKEMIQQLVHAGLLLPRRGVGPSNGGGGYWVSLPGLGKAAKSIVDGRTSLLRRLKSSQYKEKKRSVLEHEIGRIKSTTAMTEKNKNKLEQSGKFVVLDLLAKGWISIHNACTGEQFVRLVEE